MDSMYSGIISIHKTIKIHPVECLERKALSVNFIKKKKRTGVKLAHRSQSTSLSVLKGWLTNFVVLLK